MLKPCLNCGLTYKSYIKLEINFISLYNPAESGGLMSRNLLLQFEFLSLPKHCFGATLPDFKNCFVESIKNIGQDFSRVKCWVSQYRIGVLVEGLPECSLDCLKEIRGPKASTAYDYNNQPTPAAKGFAAAQGVELKDLITKEIDGDNYLFAVKSVAGQQLEKGLVNLKEALIEAIPFKTPSWSATSNFPQPLLNFTAMLDDKLLDMELEGLNSREEMFVRKNSTLEPIKINSVFHYADLMNELGVLSDLSERRKNLEAQVHLVLPEGYRMRAELADLGQWLLLSESLTPFLLKYNLESLNMPHFAVEYYINDYTEYFSCEDRVGGLLPAVVGFSGYEDPLEVELETRDSLFQDNLTKVSKLWAADREVVFALMEKMLLNDELSGELLQNREEGEFDGFLTKGVLWFKENYDVDFDINLLIVLAYLSKGIRETKVWSHSPRMALSLLWEVLEKEEYLEGLSKVLIHDNIGSVVHELRGYFSGKLPSPKSLEASIFSLCFLSELYFEDEKNFDDYMNLIWSLIISSKIKIDLFGFLSNVGDLTRSMRRAWLRLANEALLKESKLELTNDFYYGLSSLDPSSLYESLGALKALDTVKMDYLISLYNRICGKVEDIGEFLDEKPRVELEQEIDVGLKSIEIQAGINYNVILDFFLAERINIEACLLNLPSVLNEDELDHYSRISLLQRLRRQLNKLPFLKKDLN